MIPQRNLSLLANRLARGGGRRIPEAVLERDYCTAWFLVGLSRTPLRHRVAFKGGTAIKRCFIEDYRFSEDLDFTLIEEVPFEVIRSELDRVFEVVEQASGIPLRFAREDRRRHVNSHTFYLGYEGPLPAVRGAREIKVDVTISERLVLPLQERPVLQGYEEYSDLTGDALIRVYSLEEIAVEKVVALLDRARNEPRDLYDIWRLTSDGHVELAELRAEVKAKLDFRGRGLDAVTDVFRRKEARYSKLWRTRLAAQMAKLPSFEEVFRAVRRTLRQSGIA